jgi:dimethylaniline monooxygenase (N-oxide forming)
MLKTLREDGFDAVAFERRSRVGGLWSYTDDKGMTSALPGKLGHHIDWVGISVGTDHCLGTRANISKFTCGYTDFPMPDSELHLGYAFL